MKRSLAVLCLALTVLMSGCASILQRTHTSAAEHVEYSQAEDPSVLRAETYRGLVDAILYIVNDHAQRGVVRLYNYTGDVEADLAAACEEVRQKDPLTSFAVSDIQYECARIISYYEVSVTLTYSHTAREVDAIRYISGSAALRQELCAALTDYASSLTLRLSYFPGDAASVEAMAVQAWYDTPMATLDFPEIQVSLYPETGVQRIVEVKFRRQEPRTALLQRAGELLDSANALLESEAPAGENGHTPVQLAQLLYQAALPVDPAGAGDPLSALTGRGATLLGHTLALELLCRLADVETVFVSGQAEGEDVCWLAVNTDSGWRHLPVTADEPRLFTDESLAGLGYSWDAGTCPACVDEASPEPSEPVSPAPEPQP